MNQSSRAGAFSARAGESNFGDDSESVTTFTQSRKGGNSKEGSAGRGRDGGRAGVGVRVDVNGRLDFRTELLDKQTFVEKLNPIIRVARGTTATSGARRRGSLDSSVAVNLGASPNMARRGSFSGPVGNLMG